jgi:DNA (cytosine-5)-methyltransferase 1
MIHIDLFSGIGGFTLATEAVWPDIKHVFCDNDLFCQAVLKKHWPDAPIYGDIRTFANTTNSRQRKAKTVTIKEGLQSRSIKKRELERRFERPFILTGGFPCQPFSQAGRRRGTADDRYLWPEMFRVISEFHPRWVVAENVGGLVTWNDGMVLKQVCTDLEGEGYEVQPFIIPAVAVNAPHRRDRVWIVAHASNGSCEGGKLRERGERDSSRIEEGLSGRENWDEPWPSVATRLCPLDDGLPDGLVRPRGWRNAALKAAGNAIVPQVAKQIMQAISSL